MEGTDNALGGCHSERPVPPVPPVLSEVEGSSVEGSEESVFEELNQENTPSEKPGEGIAVTTSYRPGEKRAGKNPALATERRRKRTIYREALVHVREARSGFCGFCGFCGCLFLRAGFLAPEIERENRKNRKDRKNRIPRMRFSSCPPRLPYLS